MQTNICWHSVHRPKTENPLQDELNDQEGANYLKMILNYLENHNYNKTLSFILTPNDN